MDVHRPRPARLMIWDRSARLHHSSVNGFNGPLTANPDDRLPPKPFPHPHSPQCSIDPDRRAQHMDRLQAKAKEAAERLKKAADDISSSAAAAMAANTKAGGAEGEELAGSSSLLRSPSPAAGGPSLADKYAALQQQYRYTCRAAS